MSLNGLPKDYLSELLCLLLQTIHRNFQACEAPENFLVKAVEVLAAESLLRKVVLVGASNLRRCADLFEQARLLASRPRSPWMDRISREDRSNAGQNSVQ